MRRIVAVAMGCAMLFCAVAQREHDGDGRSRCPVARVYERIRTPVQRRRLPFWQRLGHGRFGGDVFGSCADTGTEFYHDDPNHSGTRRPVGRVQRATRPWTQICMWRRPAYYTGQTLTFKGNVLSNSLVSPYTSVAFIKDFAPDYSSNVSVTCQ